MNGKDCHLGVERDVGNLYARPMVIPVGGRVDGHAHNFDHATLVFSGSAHVAARLANGQVMEKDVHGPDWVLIRAGVAHEITWIPHPSALADALDHVAALVTTDPAAAARELRALAAAERNQPVTAWCVYSHRGPNGEVVQEPNGNTRAYA
jgi:hypothetical protein